nr:MAG TPA: hypothetical protein [Caudoviricetes sp.]
MMLKFQHLRSPLNPYYCTYTISSRLCAFKCFLVIYFDFFAIAILRS